MEIDGKEYGIYENHIVDRNGDKVGYIDDDGYMHIGDKTYKTDSYGHVIEITGDFFVPEREAGESGSESSWPCFITSACTRARGLPDDCHLLNLFRSFRDDYVSNLPDGKALIDEYHELAPKIVAGIDRSERSAEVYDVVYDRLVSIAKLIESGNKSEAVRDYRKLVAELKANYL